MTHTRIRAPGIKLCLLLLLVDHGLEITKAITNRSNTAAALPVGGLRLGGRVEKLLLGVPQVFVNRSARTHHHFFSPFKTRQEACPCKRAHETGYSSVLARDPTEKESRKGARGGINVGAQKVKTRMLLVEEDGEEKPMGALGGGRSGRLYWEQCGDARAAMPSLF